MFASLGMYDLPELAEATNAWWRGLARHFAAQGFRDLPDKLNRQGDPVERLKAPGLLFAQTCGFPLTHRLKDHVQLLATPRYAVPGCAGATYVSWVVVRMDDPAKTPADLRGSRVAYNDDGSQSGYNTLRALIAPIAQGRKFFGEAIESGAHRNSLAMVKAGKADVAALDCVTFALIARNAPQPHRAGTALCHRRDDTPRGSSAPAGGHFRGLRGSSPHGDSCDLGARWLRNPATLGI
jgi:hypothetical protein